jgi:predicted aminopeptidase
VLRVVALIAAAAALGGCYYLQAASGQLEVLGSREPIEAVVADPNTTDELARKLELVSEARQFAVVELHLPDNDSYRSYADIGREYVVWNVFAAPEFSLEPRTWCFPIAGCVAYRGYFSEDAARKKAGQLEEDGYDVAVGGVRAYSTLGRFDDPVLNTMVRWNDADLVATIFHELAHQLLYVKDDTEFNESFATTVAEIGLGRWLESRAETDEFDAYLERRALRRRTAALVEEARGDLDAIYAREIPSAEMRRLKRERLDQLRQRLQAEIAAAGRRAPEWITQELNNARLLSIGLYLGRVREFRDIYADCGQDLPCFYARASSLQSAGSASRR